MKMNENTPKKSRVNVSWKSRRKFEITFDERQEIINLAIAGHNMNKIAELMHPVPRYVIDNYFSKWDRKNKVSFNSKSVPYYTNEDEYGSLPTYSVDDLSPDEIEILLKNN